MLKETYTCDEKGRITWFNVPMQVKFIDIGYEGADESDVNYIGGIGYQDVIICGCCGGVESLEDLYEFAPIGTEPVVVYGDWLDIDNEIKGDY